MRVSLSNVSFIFVSEPFDPLLILSILAQPFENVQTNIARTIRSQQTMIRAKAWIDNCKDDHVECQQQKCPSDLPTRLVRVDHAEGGDDNGIFAALCYGNTLPPGTQYLTLSHLWGKAPFLKLMRNNIDQWEKSIPTNQLSPSFQDALCMTRSPGFEYIWIDSLYIIQDDIQDWEYESETMCRIYKGATCNLAASARQTNNVNGFLPSSRYLDPVVTPLVHIHWRLSPFTSSGGGEGRDFVISEANLLRHLHSDELYNCA